MQDVTLRHMSLDVNDPLLSSVPRQMEHRESIDSTMFSIQSSKSPHYSKAHHTMFSNKKADLGGFQKFDLENGESNLSTPKTMQELQSERKVVISVPNLMTEPVSKRKANLKVADMGTQVYSHSQHQLQSDDMFDDLCQFLGCNKVAIGGTCDFRVCFTTGCQRQVCQDHIAPKDPEAEDDEFMTRVC